jgi:hypothetical protein
MQLWLPLLASNTWALLVLLQTLRTKDAERLRWLQRRALFCAWLSFIGAALVIGFAIWMLVNANRAPLAASVELSQRAKVAGTVVSAAMRSIFAALLLMLLPLLTRTVVNTRNARAKR